MTVPSWTMPPRWSSPVAESRTAADLRPVSEVGLVLASASPRRLELLQRLGLSPSVRPADVDETPRPGESAQALVGRLATSKAAAVDGGSALVIAADTIVVLDGDILGKPTGPVEAAQMLAGLSGRQHAVLTAVAARFGDWSDRVVVRTEVQFRDLEAAEIAWYVATGEPLDKAGSYGLQGAGAVFVSGIVGSDTNVIGLPLEQTVALARRVGVDLLA